MKKLILFLLILFSCKAFAQTTEEFLAQKRTLIKYLTQQVAALKVYIDYAQKGYTIAKDGLNMIGDIKKGDFDLHSGYFNSLKNVNPNVQKYAKIADIIAMQINIVKGYRSSYKSMKEGGQFTGKEISYIYSVFTKVIDDAADIIGRLTDLLTADGYESDGYRMKDDERLQRIDALYMEMQDNQTFVKHFSNENYVLSVLRKNEGKEVEGSKSLNNVK